MEGWFRANREGVLILVRLTPKGGSDTIAGTVRLANGSVVVAARVRAAPEKGAANAALEKLIARTLGVAARQVSVVAGQKARIKTVRVDCEAGAIHERLAQLDGGQAQQ